MQVATPTRQHGVMIEAVENHMPQVIIIDEMGTEEEAAAARTIAERGVQLIATAHGNTLDNLILNPTLSDLVGGIQSVTLGDQEARYRGTQKTVLERKAPPTFDVVVEIQSWEQVAVHDGVAQVVDQWLRGYPIVPVIRSMGQDGEVEERQGDPRPNADPPAPWAQDFGGRDGDAGYRGRRGDRRQGRGQERVRNEVRNEARIWATTRSPSPGMAPTQLRPSFPDNDQYAEAAIATATALAGGTDDDGGSLAGHVFLFGVSRDKLEAAQVETGLNVDIVNELRRASLVLTTKTHYRRGAQLVRSAESTGTPVYVLRKNTLPQLTDFCECWPGNRECR